MRMQQKDRKYYTPEYELSVATNETSGGSTSATTDVDDVERSVTTGTSTYQTLSLSFGDELTLTNLTPGHVDVSSLPIVSPVSASSNGGMLRLTNNQGVKRDFTVSFNRATSATVYLPTGYAADSATDHCWSLIESELISTDLDLFSSVNHSTQTYTLNGSCWASGWDFSGVSVWNSRSGDFKRPITAITRRHCWGAWHYRLNIGDTVRFRRPDGTVDTHTIVGRIPGSNFASTIEYHENYGVIDYCVYTLDSALHDDIAVYEIGGDWVTKIISEPSENRPIDTGYGFNSWSPSTSYVIGGLLRLNQNREVSICPNAGIDAYAVQTTNSIDFEGHTLPRHAYWFRLLPIIPGFLTPTYDDWYLDVETGDSSSPVFTPTAADTLVLCTVLTSYVGGMMPNEEKLNKLILVSDAEAGVSTGLTVTVATDPTA